jgi:hypothetical protein
MSNQNSYTTTILVDQTPREVFDAVNNVRGWWNKKSRGSSQKLNDEFVINFGSSNRSKIKLIEVIPDRKVVWSVLESSQNSLKDKSEWKGTKMKFEISKQKGKTQLKFTHLGLEPGLECFDDCFIGWNYYIGSLRKLITASKGQPD